MVNGGVPNVMRVPQILNAALAASVIVCLAQRSPNILQTYEDGGLDVRWTALVACLIFFYTIKQYVDEYRAFEFGSNSHFSIFRTVLFGSLSYLMLAAGASNLENADRSFLFIVGYFVVLVIWSFTSLVVRLGKSEDTENNDKIKRRMLWIVLYLLAAVTLFIDHESVFGEQALAQLASFLVFSVLYLVDAKDSKTFQAAHTGGV